MKILSSFSIAHTITDDPLPDLKSQLQDSVSKKIRRTDRFIDLALIGSFQCTRNLRLNSDTGIYIGTEQGNIAETIAVAEQIFLRNQLPLPFNFINTLSNTAGFYVAMNLGLDGPNHLISQKEFLFEGILEIAALDLQMKSTTGALLGFIDEVTQPIHLSLKRQSLPPETKLAEVSAWFYVVPDESPEKEVAYIHEPEEFTSMDDLRTYVKETKDHYDSFSFSYSVSSENQNILQNDLSPSTNYVYTDLPGYNNCISAHGLDRFIKNHPGKRLLHINRNDREVFRLIEIHVSQ